METLFKSAAGLMVLGLGFTLIDFFLIALLHKIYPDPDYWEEQLEMQGMGGKRRRSVKRRQRLYHYAISHRFRKCGIVLLLLGGFLLALACRKDKGL